MHRLVPALLLTLCLVQGANAQTDRFFRTSDGVRLHYIEAGPARLPTIVFVPGWTMPAWIFDRQIGFFARSWHVVALDPRGQGESEAPATGYEPTRRGADIADLLHVLGGRPVVLVGWSLGVLDSLAYVDQAGDGRLLGMVLIDNSVGEEPAPRATAPGRRPPRPVVSRASAMRRFVGNMFRHRHDEAFLDRLTDAALRTPADAAAALLAYPVPRSFWRAAIYSVHKPILYVVTPRLTGQADNLRMNHADVQSDVYADAGHALFIDDADRFDAEMQAFLQRRVRP